MVLFLTTQFCQKIAFVYEENIVNQQFVMKYLTE